MSKRAKTAPPFASEADLAKVVIAWLRAEGWIVFQEVEHRGDIADIVATRDGKVAVIECKLHLNLEVLHQADRWLPRAHFAWAAVPERKTSSDAWRFAQTACRSLGIGLLEVESRERYRQRDGGAWTEFETYVETKVQVRVLAMEQMKGGASLLATLQPEHQTYAEAGSPTGHRWTKFRATERDVMAFVKANPGQFARAVLKVVSHHWKSKNPAGTLLVLIRRGIVKGIRVEIGKGGARLFPVEVTSEYNADEAIEIQAPVPIVPAAPAPTAIATSSRPTSSTATPSPTPRTRQRVRVWQTRGT